METVKKAIMDVKWGDIVLVDFGKQFDSEQCGIRPALVIQNNKGNQASPTIIVCAITSANKKKLPAHVDVYPEETGLKNNQLFLQNRLELLVKSVL